MWWAGTRARPGTGIGFHVSASSVLYLNWPSTEYSVLARQKIILQSPPSPLASMGWDWLCLDLCINARCHWAYCWSILDLWLVDDEAREGEHTRLDQLRMGDTHVDCDYRELALDERFTWNASGWHDGKVSRQLRLWREICWRALIGTNGEDLAVT